MKITLDIQDNQFDTFLDFIRTLDYVSIIQDGTLPEWQLDEVNRRSQMVDNEEMKTRSWEEAKAHVFKK